MRATDAPAADADVRTAARRRSLATVLAIVFIDLVGFGVIVPILPFYVRSFGVSDVFIGLLAASYSLLQFGFAPILGRLSDERGRRLVQ
jgi:MFS family permease